MTKEKKKLEKIGNYYLKKQHYIDKKLVLFRYDTIKKYFTGNHCLEIGTAEGIMTKKLVKDFKKVTCVEPAKNLLAKIKNYKNLNKINCLFEKLNSKKKYKTIILDHVLEHVKYPNQILNKIYKILHENGIFIIGVPNANSFHRLAAVEMKLLEKKNSLNQTDLALGHRRVYSYQSLKKILHKNKFKIKKFEGIFFKPFSNSQINKFLDIKIINGYYRLGKKFQKYSADICFICTK